QPPVPNAVASRADCRRSAFMTEHVSMPPSPEIEETVEERVHRVDWLSSSVERELRTAPAIGREGALLGPIKVVHALWLAGMSCDGCSVAVTGATAPSVEDLLLGR